MNDEIRLFLLRRVLPGMFGGILPGDWLRLLREARFQVDPAYWPRALLITLLSVANAVAARCEERRYGRLIDAEEPEAPLFILGHYRSGTSLLHGYLARDERLAAPTTYQVLFPHTFLTTASRQATLAPLLPRTRIYDGMRFDFDVPQEDEFALCLMTLRSHLLRYAFPRRWGHFERYATLRDVPDEEVERWRRAFRRLIRKLAWAHGRKRLVLKSPAHTGRIRLLVELFPEARFVHLHRNPYAVFQSTRHMIESALPVTALQRPGALDLDGLILTSYRRMYEAFFEERGLIPPGHLHEVAFESLERDPVGELARLYEQLALPGFETAGPAMRRYADSLAGYRKNVFHPLPPALRERVRQAWHRCFTEWGYDAC